MTDLFDIWTFLAGLGIFLFGIYLMEESIRELSGRAFKQLIRRYTETRLKGIFTGVVSTAVLQSSTAVSLMVLAFVGAGVMTLANAIAVMMGAKIGTTTTAWFVALFGFQFSIESFALPLVALGGLGVVLFSGKPRYENFSKLLAAIGFVFLGLGYMKGSVEGLTDALNIDSFPQVSLWVYLLGGILLTAITQSSTATMAIVLTMMFSEVIDFPQGASIIIGANIGTTTTVLIGSIGGIPTKRQAAVSQLLFSTSAAMLAFFLLPVLTRLIFAIPGFEGNPVLGLAMFHSTLNVIGVMIFYPFVPHLERFVRRMIPEESQEEDVSLYLRYTSLEIPEAAVEAIRKEIIHQLQLTMRYAAALYRIPAEIPSGGLYAERTAVPDYQLVAQLHADIFEYYSGLLGQEVEEELVASLERDMRASRSIMNAAKNLKELQPQLESLQREGPGFLRDAGRIIHGRISGMIDLVSEVSLDGFTLSDVDRLDHAYREVEEADKEFIRSCAKAIYREKISEREVTGLLMINRTLTQTLRMLVLSMQAIATAEELPENETVQPDFSAPELESLPHD